MFDQSGNPYMKKKSFKYRELAVRELKDLFDSP